MVSGGYSDKEGGWMSVRDYDWQIIVTLYKTHSITKAAEQLFISQPTLTKRLQVIEADLGVPLLVRGRRSSEFTAEGVRIAQKAAGVVEAIQEIKDDIAERHKGTRGVLRLGVPYSYVRYVLPALLVRYTERFPAVEVDITTTLSDELVRRVEEDALDLCFARYDAEDSYLEHILVSEDQIYAVCSHPFQLEDMPNMPYIDFSKNPVTVSAIQRWWNEHFSAPMNTRFKVTTGDAGVSMIRHGLGYSIFTDQKYFNHEEGIHALPLNFMDGTQFTRKTWLLYDKKKKNSPLIRNFIDFIQEIDVNNLY